MNTIITEKQCYECGEWKSFSEFYKNKHRKDGLTDECKICAKSKTNKWRKANTEKDREHSRQWRKANPVRFKEMLREWYRSHRERAAEYERKRRETNPEKFKEIHRKASRKYIKSHPEKVTEANHVRRARKGGGRITAREWQALKEFHNFTCLCCGKEEPEIRLELDHVLPLKLGGKNVIENAQPLCKFCNRSKGVKHIDYR